MEAVKVDNSAIYALMDRSDATHNQAVAILKKLRNSDDTIVITNLILAETHALLLSKTRLRQQVSGRSDMAVGGFPEDEERAVDIICSYEDKTFSYADASKFAVAERL